MAAAPGHSVLMEGEEHGLSVFFRVGDDVFHTYSVYACHSQIRPARPSSLFQFVCNLGEANHRTFFVRRSC
jgi:hypothetical protein